MLVESGDGKFHAIDTTAMRKEREQAYRDLESARFDWLKECLTCLERKVDKLIALMTPTSAIRSWGTLEDAESPETAAPPLGYMRIGKDTIVGVKEWKWVGDDAPPPLPAQSGQTEPEPVAAESEGDALMRFFGGK
jgi:hypothetical protein